MLGARPPFGGVARPLRAGNPFGKCRFVGTHPRLQLHYQHRAGTGLCGAALAGNLPDRRVGAIRVDRFVTAECGASARCRCHRGRARSLRQARVAILRAGGLSSVPLGLWAIVVEPTTPIVGEPWFAGRSSHLVQHAVAGHLGAFLTQHPERGSWPAVVSVWHKTTEAPWLRPPRSV